MRDYGKLRKHQSRALSVAREIVAGLRHQKVYVAGITPGGGKTLMASVFCNELADAGVLAQALIVVPADSLREQMRAGFHDLDRGLTRYLSDPGAQATLRGLGQPFGKVITYQSVFSETAAKRLAGWCRKRPTIVIFDECHHLCEHKAWERGCRQLVDAAQMVLCMSGTLWRWDEERIPFVNYDDANRALIDVRYSRAEALAEQAVLPVEFRFFNGEASYEYRGALQNSKLSTAAPKEQARTLKTCLESADYVEKFLFGSEEMPGGLRHWERYRKQHYPSQAIVVCHSKRAARQAMGLIKQRFSEFAPVLSLSSEPNADAAIKKFRKGQHQILVTVRKAYEGLDVRGATHLLYLGDARSWPFLDQVIARITRFNPDAPLSWSEQLGYVFTPDDRAMHAYVANMHDEQQAYYRDRLEAGNGVSATRIRSSFKPDTASVTEINFGLDGRVLTAEENIGIRRLEEMYPQMKAPLSDRLDMATRMALIPLAPGSSDAAE